MEKGYELRINDIRKSQLSQSDHDELYIPLQGKHLTNVEEESFDLAQKIRQFFIVDESNLNDPQVMLLMGDTGSGKSVFSQQLCQQLWQERKENGPIPLWIPLPELENPFETAVEEVLKKYGFSKSEISDLKGAEKFIFIVDGYDELHRFQNIYVTNKWNQWQAKVLITCRSQALYYQKDSDKYFVPFSGEKRLDGLLRKLYVAPFSSDQIKAYIESYNRLNKTLKIKSDDIDKIPGLRNLINTPFLLHMTVEALPDILKKYHVEVEVNQKITQAALYDVFVEGWFSRQIAKLRTARQLNDPEEKLKQQYWEYCKKLAQLMHARELSVVRYRPQQSQGRLFAKESQKQLQSQWAPFFDQSTALLRSACPLKKIGEDAYGFIHASFIEYFTTKEMYEEIENKERNEELEQVQEKGGIPTSEIQKASKASKKNKLKGGIHQRLFTQEHQVVQFLADRIAMNENFKQKMLDVVERSKKSESYAIGAANAITALVKAGVTFNGADLRAIKISGADISGGYFDRADLSNSDLSNVTMWTVWLRAAVLENCNLKGIDIGQLPLFSHSFEVESIIYRPDLDRVYVANGGDITYWNISDHTNVSVKRNVYITFRKISVCGEGNILAYCCYAADETLKNRAYVLDIPHNKEVLLDGHTEEVTTVRISENAKFLVSGSKDKTVRLWNLATKENKVFKGHEGEVNSVDLSQDAKIVISGSDDKTVRVWNVSTEAVTVLHGHLDRVNCVYLTSDRKKIISGGENIRLWDLESSTNTVICEKSAKFFQVSLDGSKIAFTNSFELHILDVNSKKIAKLFGNAMSISSIGISPDGKTMMSGSRDQTVRGWSIDENKMERREFGSFLDEIKCVSISSDAKIIVSGHQNGKVQIWNNHGTLMTVFEDSTPINIQELRQKDIDRGIIRSGNERSICSLQVSGDGKVVASGVGSHLVNIWDINSRKELVFKGHQSPVYIIDISVNGQIVVSKEDDGRFCVWDTLKKQELNLWPQQKNNINCVCISQDGTQVVIGRKDSLVQMWDLKVNHNILLKGHSDSVNSVCISSSKKIIVSGGMDAEVRLWNVLSKENQIFKEGNEPIHKVIISYDENYVLTESKTYLRVWNIKSKSTSSLPVSNFDLTFLRLSRDGKTVFFRSNSELHLWNIANQNSQVIHRSSTRISARSVLSMNDEVGLLVLGGEDGLMQVWKRIDSEEPVWQLSWSTYQKNDTLCVMQCNINECVGLSHDAQLLFTQGGAQLKHEEKDASDYSSPSSEKKTTGSKLRGFFVQKSNKSQEKKGKPNIFGRFH